MSKPKLNSGIVCVKMAKGAAPLTPEEIQKVNNFVDYVKALKKRAAGIEEQG